MQTTIKYKIQELSDVPVNQDWLHPSEKEVAAQFRFPKRKNDWLLGRWTAKQLVRTFFGNRQLNEIEIRAAADGAPEVFCDDQPMPVTISISHSHDWGFCVATNETIALGCDLEKIETRSLAFLKDYFTENEFTFISKENEPSKALYSNLLWSAKESVLKALRVGLKIYPRNIEIELSEFNNGILWQPFQANYLIDSLQFFGWWQQRDGFVFTIVSNKDNIELQKGEI